MVTRDTSASCRPSGGSTGRSTAGTTGGFAGADAVARVSAVLRGEAAPVPARPAATVVLVRDSPDGPEVYLLRRVATMAFAAGMTVFPGGGVDPRDADAEVGWVGPPPREWAAALGADPGLARALVCAAVRETFEESGVLLAGPTPDTVCSDVDDAGWEADRQALLARTEALAPLLARRGLLLRADLLRPWAHWVTPEAEPRRYDTRFLVAALPEGQRPRDVGGEADLRQWLRPPDALAAARRGEMALMHPTVAALEAVAEHASTADVLAARPRIAPVMPRFVPDADGGLTLLLPGEPGWDEAGPGTWGSAS